MGHEGQFSKVRSSQAADNMVTHVRKGKITSTSDHSTPKSYLGMLHKGNNTSGAGNMLEPNH
eukprot:9576739-Karenia_brevis.AAC.1